MMENIKIMNEMKLRPAVIEDIKRIFLWRNHPETRRFSFNNDEIKWQDHDTWFRKALKRSDQSFLIGEIEGEAIGVLRFDINKEKMEAEINIFLDPVYYGKGLGASMILAGKQWLRSHKQDIKKIIAKVLHNNIRSNKVFIKAGFKPNHIIYELTII